MNKVMLQLVFILKNNLSFKDEKATITDIGMHMKKVITLRHEN